MLKGHIRQVKLSSSGTKDYFTESWTCNTLIIFCTEMEYSLIAYLGKTFKIYHRQIIYKTSNGGPTTDVQGVMVDLGKVVRINVDSLFDKKKKNDWLTWTNHQGG